MKNLQQFFITLCLHTYWSKTLYRVQAALIWKLLHNIFPLRLEIVSSPKVITCNAHYLGIESSRGCKTSSTLFSEQSEFIRPIIDKADTGNWRSLDHAMMRQNQCVSCTECVNIPEFRLKTSNIRFIEKTLEENPVHGQRMDLPEIEAQPALQAVRNNRRRDIPIDQLQRRAINKVYKTIPKKVPKKQFKEF